MRIRITTIIISVLFLGGCVSVDLGSSKTTPAKDVKFQEPKSPFKEIKAANSDKTWLSQRTGNTISFLSECGNAADPSLISLENESLSVMNQLVVTRSEVGQFNGREARISEATGQVDGVPVQISLLVFKKNGCNYTLSYSGVRKGFGVEEQYFQDFLKNFKAP